MTKKQFLDAVNEIDDEFIKEIINTSEDPHENYFDDEQPQKVYLTNKPIAFWKIAVSTATAICVLTGGIFASEKLRGIYSDDPNKSGTLQSNAESSIGPSEGDISEIDAEGSVVMYVEGSSNNMSVKIMYENCNMSGKLSESKFSVDYPKFCSLTFTATAPKTKIEFYKVNNNRVAASFTTPERVSGMPSTLTTSIRLETGMYKVRVSSANISNVSGIIKIDHVDGAHS